MKRLALLLPLLAATGTACYGPHYAPPDGGRYSRYQDRYEESDVPLAVRLEQDAVGYSVRLNDPAYIAVFQILPGRGVGLFAPSYEGSQTYYPAGHSTLPNRAVRYFSYFDAAPARYWREEPTFYLVVASRRPLRMISRFQHNDGALRSVLGVSGYSTFNYRRVVDDIINAVVPNQPDDDWTTDLLAVWPNQGYDRYAYGTGYVPVQCWGGGTALLPVELARWGCTRRERPVTVNNPGNTPPPARDTSTVVAPGRRRPEPTPTTPGTVTVETIGGGFPAGPRVDPLAPTRGDGTPTDRGHGGVGDGPRVAAPGGSTTREVTPREEQPRVAPQVDRQPQRAEPRDEPRVERSIPRESPRPEPRVERSEPRPEPRVERSAPREEPRPSPPPQVERSAPPPPPRESRPEPRPEPVREPVRPSTDPSR